MSDTVMTLEANGVQKTLADWNIDPDVVKTTKHRGEDTLTFRMTIEDGRTAPVFASNTRIIVRTGVTVLPGRTPIMTGGTVWFVGRTVDNPIELGANNESHGYTVYGPWLDLEQIRFQQQWFAWNGSAQAAHDTTHVLLPWKNNNGTAQLLTLNEQITEAINYAINRSGLQIALGTIDLIRTAAVDGYDAFTVTLNEYRDISVAEVITNMLNWARDAIMWWDYSNLEGGVPKPKFHCIVWKRLPEVTRDLTGTTTVPESVQIQPRYDLQTAGVVFRFERGDIVDDDLVRRYGEDVYPPGTDSAAVGVMAATFDLQGAKLTFSKADIECATIDAFSNTPATRLAWWLDHLQWLNSGYFRNVTVDVATRDGTLSLPLELISGAMPDWLLAPRSNGFATEEETIRAELRYEKWSAPTGGEKQSEIGLNGTPPQVITINLVATNATTGHYSDIKDNQPGEQSPPNMARMFYEATSILHWSGSVVDVQEEITGEMRIGLRLNLTNGLAAWATMQAAITTVTERPHVGTTQVEFGPPDRIGPQDFLELHRVNRRERWRWTASDAAASGSYGASQGVSIGSVTPRQNSTSGPTSGGAGVAGWG
jgi:hypothetical protein